MPIPNRTRRVAARRGAAAVEFALLLPVLLYLLAIGADWARLYYYAISLNGCARSGALYASDPVAMAQSPYPTLQEAAAAEAPDLDPPPTVTSSQTIDDTGHPAVRVTVSMPFRTITRLPGVPSSQTLSRSVQMRLAPTKTN